MIHYEIELEDVLEFIYSATDFERSTIKAQLNGGVPESIYDQMKSELFEEASKKYTLQQLQEKLK